MKNSTCILLLISIFFSCSSSTERKEQAMRKEIMNTHDELMPKMNNIKELKIQLQENKELLLNENMQSATGGAMSEHQLDSLIQALDIAENSMIVWMENYNEFNEETFTHSQQMDYLRQEREKIEAVKLKFLSSIMEAEAVLGQRP
jgi:ribosomal protein L29